MARRKRALLRSLQALCAASLVCALAPTAACLAVGRFATGSAVGGLVVAAFTHLIEASPAAHRNAITLWVMLSASFVVALLGPAAYILRGHWRLLPVVSAAPAVFMVLAAGEPFEWVEESPVRHCPFCLDLSLHFYCRFLGFPLVFSLTFYSLSTPSNSPNHRGSCSAALAQHKNGPNHLGSVRSGCSLPRAAQGAPRDTPQRS